ncbi:MAG: HAMP domain-containing sensor histidine kinase [bacterium]|nr:HAMP domain-containing sensor histidine kinase [bacterium]
MKKFLENINVFRQCREFDVPLWSCPRFLFVLMGAVIIISILVTYFVGERYATPEMVIATVTALTIILMIIMHVIVQAFEQVVVARRAEIAHAKQVLLLRDQFVYIAIHHLRAGGTAIKWGLKLLEGSDGALSSSAATSSGTPAGSAGDAREIVRQMRRKNDDLLKLAENILLVTRIDSGALAIGKEEVSVREMIEGALADEKELIAEHSVRVSVLLADKTLQIMGDPIYVRETLGLLLTNAIERSARISPIVRISATQKGGEVEIAIQDNGPMIPPEELEHIFEHYWRASGPGKSEGSGFPLYIAHELVRLMQGRIWFSSVEGATEATIALPMQ